MTINQFNEWVDSKSMSAQQIARCARLFLRTR